MVDMLVRLYALPRSAPRLRRDYAVRRAMAYEQATVVDWISKQFSQGWGSEANVAFSRQPISCFLALHKGELVGFACYEATCRGFFGPTGVAVEHRRHGLGQTLLLESLKSLKAIGYAYAILGGVGPKRFYKDAVGAIEIPGSTLGIYARKSK